MAVPASKVKQVCTASEAALVRSSRKPALQSHSVAELKRFVVRARGLADKWEGQGRAQVRARAAKAGAVDREANTALKGEIFRDAMANFANRLAELEATGAPSGRKPGGPGKARRSATHRAARAVVRQDLAEQHLELKTKRRKSARPASGKAAKAVVLSNAPAGAAAGGAKPKKKGAPKPLPPVTESPRAKTSGIIAQKARQRKATTAAKKARVAASGKSSRVRGHVLARGRRAQAARDARN